MTGPGETLPPAPVLMALLWGQICPEVASQAHSWVGAPPCPQ